MIMKYSVQSMSLPIAPLTTRIKEMNMSDECPDDCTVSCLLCYIAPPPSGAYGRRPARTISLRNMKYLQLGLVYVIIQSLIRPLWANCGLIYVTTSLQNFDA
jgi:hypothetical protein